MAINNKFNINDEIFFYAYGDLGYGEIILIYYNGKEIEYKIKVKEISADFKEKFIFVKEEFINFSLKDLVDIERIKFEDNMRKKMEKVEKELAVF